MKTTICLLLGFLCLLAANLKVQAVIPPPDGGYPGGNTAEGQNALLNLSSGGYNTAVGFVSLVPIPQVASTRPLALVRSFQMLPTKIPLLALVRL